MVEKTQKSQYSKLETLNWICTYTNMMEETKWNMMQLLESKFVTDPPHCERLPSSGASIIKPTKLLNNIDLQHHKSVTQIQKEGYTVYIYILHIFTFSRGGKLKSSLKRGNVSDHDCIKVVGMCGSSYHICTQIAIWILSQKCQFEEMQEALNEYVKYGACFSKSRVCFTHTNILHYNYMIFMIFILFFASDWFFTFGGILIPNVYLGVLLIWFHKFFILLFP